MILYLYPLILFFIFFNFLYWPFFIFQPKSDLYLVTTKTTLRSVVKLDEIAAF